VWSGLSWEDVVWVGADEINARMDTTTTVLWICWPSGLLSVGRQGRHVVATLLPAIIASTPASQVGHANRIDMSPPSKKEASGKLWQRAGSVFDNFHGVAARSCRPMEEVRRRIVGPKWEGANALERTSWVGRKNPYP